MSNDIAALLVLGFAAVSALPADPVIRKVGSGPRFQHIADDNGNLHLVDSWLTVGDLQRAARYSPDTENVYHLFTRLNPNVSHPILYDNNSTLEGSYFDADKNTVMIIHGWNNDATSDVNAVLVSAFLTANDSNLIVVDWSAGANDLNYFVSAVNAVTSGESVARFIDWFNEMTGATPEQYHIVGHSLGGQQSGVVGRNVDGDIAYITALDPAGPAFELNPDRFSSTDGNYTEVIHTNAGLLGYLEPLGQVDFYPNGGFTMPGCGGLVTCNHARSYYYLAESVVSGGFTGVECESYLYALLGACALNGTLNMGGTTPKTGSTGVYYLETNAAQPFSQG